MDNTFKNLKQRCRDEGKIEGEAIGKSKGKVEGMILQKITTIINMLKQDFSESQILSLDFTKDEIEQAKKQLMQS